MGDHERLDMSFGLGLTATEHVALTGLAMSRRSAKDLVRRYDEVLSDRLQADSAPVEVPPAPEPEPAVDDVATDDGPSPGQTTLF